METMKLERDDGYRGVWYYNEHLDNEYRFKYSGGLGTYPQQIAPLACYAQQVERTFFCYGGSPRTRNEITHMISYFDHATGTVPRPAILAQKGTDDAHDMTAMAIDEEGHIWLFSNSHGVSRESWVHRSARPYCIDEFERLADFNFSYSQPHWIPAEGLFLPHTHYTGDERGALRRLYFITTRDGREWRERSLLAFFERGHYQVSARRGARVATAFNTHPEPLGVNARTDLYYLETDDMGETWRNVAGDPLDVPLRDGENPALVHDYRSEGLLVYLKTLQFDASGNPVILYLTSRGFESGPKNAPRTWQTARWDGAEWIIREVTTSDNNYDFGPLYIEEGGTWRLIAPTAPGPQPYNPGGEVAMWLSPDRGLSWQMHRQLTAESERNHTYVRRPLNAHPDFYALWADGHARQLSRSCLYFTDREGTQVRRLPPEMNADSAEPELAW